MRAILQTAAAVVAFATAAVAAPKGYSSPPGFRIEKRYGAVSYGGKAYGCWCNDVCKSPFRDFKHVGCYDKSSDPSVWFLEWKSPYLPATNVTKQNCFAQCKGMGTRYAAIGGGGKECWCGNDLTGNACKADKCDSTCSGDPSGSTGQNCGGTYTFSVYKDATYSTDIENIDVDAAAEGYVTQGCYWDDPERVVRFNKESSDNMNLSRCKSRCASLGYPWMMVENGNSCFCGGALRDNAELAGSAGACNMPCTGEGGENCGGWWAGFVYYNEDLDSKEPCGAPMKPEEPPKPTEPPKTKTTTTKKTKTTKETKTTTTKKTKTTKTKTSKPPKTTAPPENPEEPPENPEEPEEPQVTSTTTTKKTTAPPEPTNPPENPEEPPENPEEPEEPPVTTTKKTSTTTEKTSTKTTTAPPEPTGENPEEPPENPEEPPENPEEPEEPQTICVMPEVPGSEYKKYKGITYPLGGHKAPPVSCHNDEAKFKAGFHFKLFPTSGAKCRLDYKHTTKEIQAACWNACIEQSKICLTSYASKKVCKGKTCWETSALATQCKTQLQACKDANTEKSEVIVKANNEWCKNYGDKPDNGGEGTSEDGYFRRFL